MALFAMVGKAEVTSRGKVPELDNKKSRGARARLKFYPFLKN
jgi:hypothetical protein